MFSLEDYTADSVPEHHFIQLQFHLSFTSQFEDISKYMSYNQYPVLQVPPFRNLLLLSINNSAVHVPPNNDSWIHNEIFDFFSWRRIITTDNFFFSKNTLVLYWIWTIPWIFFFCAVISKIHLSYSSFSQTHKIGNIDIFANSVFPHIWSFLPYLYHLLLINVKLNISGKKSIIFQDCRLHWCSSFLMTQLKQSWQ